MFKILAAALLAALGLSSAHAASPPKLAPRAALTACTAGAINCSNDTVNDQLLAAAITDTSPNGTQNRVWNLWNGQCNNIYSEAGTTVGHVYRINFCQSIGAGNVPKSLLVSTILNSTVAVEVLAGTGSPTAGNMVDADVNSAIGAAMTVSNSSASTTATFSPATNLITVASSTGIVPGQTVACAGVIAGSLVLYVNSTNVVLNTQTTAPETATPCAFNLYTGLPTRAWP